MHERHVYRNELQFYMAIGMCILAGMMMMGGVLHAVKHSFVLGMLFVAINCIMIVVVFGRMALTVVIASGSGVHVANMFSSFDLQWGEIDHFDLGAHGKVMSQVCRVHLNNGRVLSAFAVQENRIGGGSAVRMVDELNRELETRRASGSIADGGTAGKEPPSPSVGESAVSSGEGERIK
jgi:hypothetical protein